MKSVLGCPICKKVGFFAIRKIGGQRIYFCTKKHPYLRALPSLEELA